MKILVVDTFHHKNRKGIEMICKYLDCEYRYTYGNIVEIEKLIPEYDIIYFPVRPYDPSRFPNKRFIFGPHFSVFPDNRILQINNIHNNSMYIQPSNWVSMLWKSMNADNILPIKTFPFPVDTERFTPNPLGTIKQKIFIYFKARDPNQLRFIEDTLNNQLSNTMEYKVFDYRKRYKEEDYISWLKESQYGIWIGCHESQGFALEEALSCNVPLLVWNVKSMNQEHGSRYADIPATSIPYWDARCGEYFYKEDEFVGKYNEFISKLSTYKPREFVLENLSVEMCGERLKKLINL